MTTEPMCATTEAASPRACAPQQEKTDGGRQVHYVIEIEGMRKERKAVVTKNEEGAWKVTAITDAD